MSEGKAPGISLKALLTFYMANYALLALFRLVPLHAGFRLVHRLADSFLLRRTVFGKIAANTAARMKGVYGSSRGEDEIAGMSRRQVANFLWQQMSMYYGLARGYGYLAEFITVEGLANIIEARKQHRGLLVVTGHYEGNYFLLARLLKELGEPIMLFGEFSREPVTRVLQDRIEKKLPVRFIEARDSSAAELQKFFEEDRIVFSYYDAPKKNGIPVIFLGKEATSAVGPMILSRRCGAPVVPMVVERQGFSYHGIILPQRKWGPAEDEDAFMKVNAEGLTKIFSDWTEGRPEQWEWVNKWKYAGAGTAPPGKAR